MKTKGLWLITGLWLIAPSTPAQDVLLPAVDARVKELQEYQRKFHYRPTNLPHSLSDGKTYRFIHDAFEAAQDFEVRARSAADGNFEILLSRNNSGFPQFATEDSAASGSHKFFARFSPDVFGEFDIDKNALVNCPRVPASGMAGAITVGNDYVAAWTDDKEIKLVRYTISDANCVMKPLATVPTPNGRDSRLVNQQGKIGLYFQSDAAEVRIFDVEGKLETKRSLPGFKLGVHGKHMFPAPSVSAVGTLIPLARISNPGIPPDLHLMDNDGNLRLIAKGAHNGVWTKEGNILANEGRHANSSELILYSSPGFTQKKTFAQPEGMKSVVSDTGNALWYLNHRADAPAKVYRDSAPNFGKPTEVKIESHTGKIESPELKNARMPHAQEVVYPSDGGKRKIPSILSLPDEDCVSGIKKPVVVYLHGGNFEGSPEGHFRTPSLYDDLLFTQLGYVVVNANYYGNKFTGPEFGNGARYLDTERQLPQLADIQAAGEYARRLPCADPDRIILLGHSYGAYLASLYATSKEYQANSPFSGIVIKNGMYSEKEIVDFFNNPRVAFRDTDEDRDVHGIKAECVLKPKPPIVGVNAALKFLAKEGKSGKYCGVLYSLESKTLDAIVPARRASSLNDIPLLVVQGEDGSRADAIELAKAFEKTGKKVLSWFPDDLREEGGHRTNGHNFEGETEREFVRRVYGFVSGLPGQDGHRRKEKSH
jgi:predicted esterase